ncbi:COG4695 Phage-related protein [uncultured Caudovirales phage]|uniref:COG4695 Phage-related protein n=1 Tax=uncultured Caudovirales phage TaxID=2100421 RepID=A0A6J5SVR8_9CAUD|nr:COG4695 Phage-related protein [uncultured Caudovirales phage]CAB4219662.1 COG4695 Phage-related protein [uncultured Caudovirales phage]
MAFRQALERRSAPEQSVINRLMSQRLGTDNASGIRVTPDAAVGVSTVYACVRLLSDSVSSLPLGAFMHAGRERVGYAEVNGTTPNWVERPNPDMTRLEFWGQVVASMLLNGNAFILTVRSPYGEVLELYVIHPDEVRIKRPYVGAPTEYHVRIQTPNGPRAVVLDRTEMLHIPLFLLPGALYGLSPISAAEVTIGGAMAADIFAASHFRNSANPSGSIETPNPMTPAQIKELADGWNLDHQGSYQAGKVGILTNGAEFKPIMINAQDAQLLETRRFNVEEIARLYRVPVHKLGHPVAGAMSFASVEAQNLSFVVDSLRTLVERVEQAVKPLLPNPEGFVKFNLDALLRGTTKERYDAYAVAMDRGFISVNDIMASEDKPGIGPAGDAYRVVLQNIDAADAVNTGVDLKVKIAMQLVEGGFDPEDSLRFAGLDPIKYAGTVPTKQTPQTLTTPPTNLDPTTQRGGAITEETT